MRRLLQAPARLSLALVSAALIANLAAPVVLGAKPSITFGMTMFGDCLAGRATPNATVNVTWRAMNNALKEQGSTASDSHGAWEFCATDPANWVAPLDAVKVSDGSSTRNYLVPNLSMTIDRVTDVVTGTGPAGRTPTICPSWKYSDYGKCHGVRVKPDGTWSYSTDGLGSASVSVNWKSPNGDYLYLHASAPSFNVTLGKSSFSGSVGTPRGHAQVDLNGGSKGAGDAVGDEYGDFSGQLVDNHGHAVTVAAGDHVASSIASDADWIMPQIQATADRVTDIVTGNCQDTGTSRQEVWFDVLHSGHYRGSAVTDLAEDGSFWVDFHDPGFWFSKTNLKKGDRLVISCDQTTNDVAQLKLVVH